MSFDIEHVIKNATNDEKWSLLSGRILLSAWALLHAHISKAPISGIQRHWNASVCLAFE
jgi:hypothetical protein